MPRAPRRQSHHMSSIPAGHDLHPAGPPLQQGHDVGLPSLLEKPRNQRNTPAGMELARQLGS
eukprot:293247-Alexandrium_andersonii.AAC.1